MFEALEAIRNAAQLLAVRDPSLTERLLQACEILWEQMYEAGDWPARFEERAQVLMKRLMANGSIEATLDALDEAGASAVAQDIIRFASDINAWNGVPARR